MFRQIAHWLEVVRVCAQEARGVDDLSPTWGKLLKYETFHLVKYFCKDFINNIQSEVANTDEPDSQSDPKSMQDKF